MISCVPGFDSRGYYVFVYIHNIYCVLIHIHNHAVFRFVVFSFTFLMSVLSTFCSHSFLCSFHWDNACCILFFFIDNFCSVHFIFIMSSRVHICFLVRILIHNVPYVLIIINILSGRFV